MSFWKKIRTLLAPEPADESYYIYVKCRRCQEMVKGRVHLKNDLSLQDDGTYLVRKTLIGEKLCFNRIEVTLVFDKNRNLLDETISGGSFITAVEYGDELPPKTM